MEGKRKKIFVGMSGGVDSSVSAALLKRDGYEVIGVFIKVWQADFLPCTWREERRDAIRAAAHLGIPLITLDLEKEYKEEVVDYMIAEYGKGRVPNPDVMCNKYVKFGAFLDFAKKHGADAIATGHYAQVHPDADGKFHLYKGVDVEKDQSYFLWTLTQAELPYILFPVGHLEKKAVRMLGREFGLPNAEKKDSQGLCFMGAIDMKDFLKHYLSTKPGKVLDEEGRVIGTHDGAMLYTIGQRHGFQTEKRGAQEAPLFVISKNVEENTITVSAREIRTVSIDVTNIPLEEVNMIATTGEHFFSKTMMARIRYRGELSPVTFFDPVASSVCMMLPVTDEHIASGQSIVFYDGEECLGGAVIGE